MIPTSLSKLARAALWLSPVALVMAAFFAAMPWLATLDDAVVTLIGAAAAIFVMAYAVFVSVRVQRVQDEVQRAGSRFAYQVGALGGSIVTVLLLLVPPFQALLVDAANQLGTGAADTSDRGSVLIAVFFGFGLLSLLQSVGALIANAAWSWWVGRP